MLDSDYQLPAQNRKSETGKLIDRFLHNEIELEKHAAQLIFTANRWEKIPEIKSLLSSGTTVVIDRYVASGVAYGAAMGLPVKWCSQNNVGHPEPDLVVYLKLSAEAASKRKGYGEERFEKENIQQQVANTFDDLKEDSWKIIDGDGSEEYIHAQIYNIVKKVIEESKFKELGTLE
ncbi:thymidylate kinase-like [Gigantopelta aegis]|uniref:thymidylate kinase-like n=1 Tax=Gigantopelta aegis TaxID=1735272 RepID=UPI001B88B773|nr:thymidylate kinase-like [Gigantopelta aegis]